MDEAVLVAILGEGVGWVLAGWGGVGVKWRCRVGGGGLSQPYWTEEHNLSPQLQGQCTHNQAHGGLLLPRLRASSRCWRQDEVFGVVGGGGGGVAASGICLFLACRREWAGGFYFRSACTKGPSQKYLEANEVKYFSLLP